MDAFTALADPNRRRMVELLKQGSKTAGEIQTHFPITPSAVSQHLKVLRDTQLVTVQVDAQRRIYSLNFHTIDEASQWLQEIKAFWDPRLDRLQQAMEKNQ